MAVDPATFKPWAVTPEPIDEAVSRLMAAASPERLIAHRCAEDCGYGSAATGDRYQEKIHLRHALRGWLRPIDLIVTSQESDDDRAQVQGTVEFADRTHGRVL